MAKSGYQGLTRAESREWKNDLKYKEMLKQDLQEEDVEKDEDKEDNERT